MEIKEKIKKYYAGMGIKVDNDYIEGILKDSERTSKMIRLYEEEKVNTMNYILGKPQGNNYFTQFELEAMSKINLFNRKVVEICKNIYAKEILGGVR
jgi:hypothetical protein